MSDNLPGNPHADGPINYMAEMHAGGRSDQAMVASAMLTLAHEQRTANLIAVFGNMMDGETDTFLGERIDGYELAKQIQERLGL